MTSKIILSAIIAIAFVVGTITTGTNAFAANPFDDLQQQVDDIVNGIIIIPIDWSDIIGIPADIADGDADLIYTDADAIAAVGPHTTSLSWTSITSVPANVADGNTDTLADLSCTTDQIAKFDGSQWICIEDISGVLATNVYVRTNTISHDSVVRDDWSIDCDNASDLAIGGGVESSMDQAHLIVNTPKIVNGFPNGWKGSIL